LVGVAVDDIDIVFILHIGVSSRNHTSAFVYSGSQADFAMNEFLLGVGEKVVDQESKCIASIERSDAASGASLVVYR
jgi:hypothetical protein